MSGADPDTVAVYAAQIEDYKALGVNAIHARAVSRFLRDLPEGAEVLDLGCGPGHHAVEMMKAGCRVTAIDATPAFVEVARAAGVDAKCRTFNELDEDGAFDGVWASFSLLHTPRADLPRHLGSIHRALRPGGGLFLGMKLGEGEGRDALGRFYSYHSEAEFRSHLAAVGFIIDAVISGVGKGLAGTEDPYILIHAHA